MSLAARLLRPLVGNFITSAQMPVDKQRAQFERLRWLPRPRGVRYQRRHIGGVDALWAVPQQARPGVIMIYIHGGGYVIGSAQAYSAFAGRLAQVAKASAWVLNYRLAPEHPFPAVIEDVVSAYLAILAETRPERVVFVGDSAGGGAILSTLVALRNARQPLPACAVVFSPFLDLALSGESVTTKAAVDPIIDVEWARQAATMYAAGRDRADPGISPLFSDLSGLPPLLVQAATDEVLLSDSMRLAEKARAAGIDVTLEIEDDLWHVYQILTPVLPEAKQAVERVGAFILSRT